MNNINKDTLYDTAHGLQHVRPHLISVLVKNEPGVLARVSGLFSRRGFNIDSLAVGISEDSRFSRMTIAVIGDDHVLEQITKQLHKLIDTYKVVDLSSQKHVERELMLIHINTDKNDRSELLPIIDLFKAQVVEVKEKSVMVEIAASSEKLKSFEDMVRKFGIIEMARTGKIALHL